MDSDSGSSPDMQVEEAPSPAPCANRKASVRAPGAPKPAARVARRTMLVSYVCEKQPTFGDTDDELGISEEHRVPSQPVKKAKIAKKERKGPVARRLFVSSEGALLTKVDELVCNDLNVAIAPMNYSITNRKFNNDAHYMQVNSYRCDAPAENLDVDETGNAWEPGAAELAGIAVNAYEIADFLLESERNAVIVVSKRGGNAPKLLAGCAAQAVRKLAAREEAALIVGHQAPHPTGELKKVFDAFPKWTRITAPHDIASFA